MDNVSERNHEIRQDSEIQFLAALEQPSPDIEKMFSLIWEAALAGAVDMAEERAVCLQGLCRTRKDLANGLRLLAMRSEWRGHDAGFHSVCHEEAGALLDERIGPLLMKSAGFAGQLPAGECIRRLAVLVALKPGVFCWDRTWRFGVVKRSDLFYERIIIDFTGKPGHTMSLSYAAEALELIGRDHLFVRWHMDRQAVTLLVQDNPAEIVRSVLRSFGPRTVAEVQSLLVPTLVPEAAWKTFWDGARKGLKGDGTVDIPSKRTETIRFIEKSGGFDANWFDCLEKERDLDALVGMLANLTKKPHSLTEANRALIKGRIAYIQGGAETSRPELVLKTLILAKKLGIVITTVDGNDPATRFLLPGNLVWLLSRLPGRDMEPAFRFLAACDAEKTVSTLLDVLILLPGTALDEAIGYLTTEGGEAAVLDRLRMLVQSREASVSVVGWICRHVETALAANIRLADLLSMAVDVLDSARAGEELRVQNNLQTLFEKREWVERVLGGLDAMQRDGLMRRINRAGGWDVSRRRSVMANMIRLYPELEGCVAGEGDAVGPSRHTSWRSYRERQAQLQQLVEVTIPQNSRDIGTARSYGDLRENFEYHAAKDQQRLLFQRQRELELELKRVHGSDLSGFPTDRAGIGTCVELQAADGRRWRYSILGEWDRDEALGIISNKSLVAQRVEGCAVGDTVRIPGDPAVDESGEVDATVVRIDGLPEEVRVWAGGKPVGGG
jgi:transcription elongation GreA/GreB family factor